MVKSTNYKIPHYISYLFSFDEQKQVLHFETVPTGTCYCVPQFSQ